MSLFVKEAQPPPGCGRHKWPDSHGPADNRRPCVGRGGSQAEPSPPSPHSRLGGKRRAQVRARCLNRPVPPSRRRRSQSARAGGCPTLLSPGRCVPPRGGSAGAGQTWRHRCRDGAASLCQPQARVRSSGRRPESGTRRGGQTFDARPCWSPPIASPLPPPGALQSPLRTPRNLRADRGGEALAGGAAFSGVSPSQPATSRLGAAGEARWERGRGSAPAEGRPAARPPLARTFRRPRPPSRTI